MVKNSMQRLRLKLQETISLSVLILLICLTTLIHTAQAHEGKPAIAIITVDSEGILKANITTHLEAMIMGGAPDHDSGDFKRAGQYLKLRQLSAIDLKISLNEFTGELLDGIEIHADGKRLITSLEHIAIPDIEGTRNTRESVITIITKLPKDAKTITWRWKKEFGTIALRIHSPSQQDVFNAYLASGVVSEGFALQAIAPKVSQ